jgi:hypothetical protein
MFDRINAEEYPAVMGSAFAALEVGGLVSGSWVMLSSYCCQMEVGVASSGMDALGVMFASCCHVLQEREYMAAEETPNWSGCAYLVVLAQQNHHLLPRCCVLSETWFSSMTLPWSCTMPRLFSAASFSWSQVHGFGALAMGHHRFVKKLTSRMLFMYHCRASGRTHSSVRSCSASPAQTPCPCTCSSSASSAYTAPATLGSSVGCLGPAAPPTACCRGRTAAATAAAVGAGWGLGTLVLVAGEWPR